MAENNDNTAKEMLDLVAQNLKEHEWRFRTKDFEDGEYAIDTDITSKSGFFKFYEIRMLFRKWDMQTIYYLPVKAPEAFRAAVCEYLMRVNWRIKYGKFTMDFEDGELRYEYVFQPAAVRTDADDVLGDALDVMSGTADKYAPGLMAIIFGGKSAAAAFEDIVKRKEKDAPPPGEPPAAGGACVGGAGASSPAAKGGRKRRGKKTSPEKTPAPPADKSNGQPISNQAKLPRYSLKGLNIQGKIPLEKIIAAVRKFRAAECADVDAPRLNILLSGAPGSGKTAFARYLAGEVGAPLRTIRASDLLSKWVGETEKKLAEVFREAKAKGEILFLDEIDSFLQDRAGAEHGWEVTQVNQLLQEMEDFQGVLIGATNFSDRLDKAVLRRFTYKLKLDYLTDEGKGIFFEKYFETPLTAEETTRLNAIGNLTPGDFRTVREELFYLDEEPSNMDRIEALENESAAKGISRPKIGFSS